MRGRWEEKTRKGACRSSCRQGQAGTGSSVQQT